MEKIVARLTQHSTWRGLILLVGGIGSVIHPEHAVALIGGAITLVGAINVARSS